MKNRPKWPVLKGFLGGEEGDRTPDLRIANANVSLVTMLIFAFLIAVGCGVSSPLLLGLSLHPFPKLAGAGSALQGAIKMAGSGLALWLIALFRPTELTVLMIVIFVLAAISLVLGLLVTLPRGAHEILAADKAG